MAFWGGEKRGGIEGSLKPAVSAMRKTPSVGSQEDQRWWKNSAVESEHDEGALDQPQHDFRLEYLCELHRAARSGDVPGVERVLAPGDTGVDKRDRKKSIQQLIPEYKEKQTPESLAQNNNPDWHPTNLTLSDKTCQRSKILNVDDKCPSVSPSMPENQSATKELGQMNLAEREKMNIGVILLSENDNLHDLCQSQLPENKESKEVECALCLLTFCTKQNTFWQDICILPLTKNVGTNRDLKIADSNKMWFLCFIFTALNSQLSYNYMHYNLKGRGGCSEPRLRHCTPAWAIEGDPISKNKKQKNLPKANIKDVGFGIDSVLSPVQIRPGTTLKNISVHSCFHNPFPPCALSLALLNFRSCPADPSLDCRQIHILFQASLCLLLLPVMLSLFPVPYPLTKNVNQNSDSCSTNNYKSLKPKLENLSSLPPDSDRTSEVYLHEELQQDMQKFKNEVDTLEEEFLALKKENIQLHKEVEEEIEKHTSNRTELTGTLTDGATVGSDDDGLNQQIPRKENGEHDRSADKASNENNKVKNQIHPGADFADSVEPSETASENCELSHSVYENFMLLMEQLRMECKDSVSLPRIQDTFCLCECLLKLKNNRCDQLRVKIKQTENTVSLLQNELSETKKTKLELEHQKIEWEKELYDLR
uniref:CCDC144C-like coiled-coil domain-containing protein n=1 Tax=Chlorocebus sabaeus TaxID=60711 RepID=A0A0D9R918_CHLSB